MFIVIATAYRSNLTTLQNEIRNKSALAAARRVARVKGVKMATGYYKEDQAATATIERSFIFSVASRKDVKKLRDLFCGRFEQDCILYKSNAAIQLIGTDWAQKIGDRFKVINDVSKLQAYTLLDNGIAFAAV